MVIKLADENDIEEISKLWLDMVKELYPDNSPDKQTWQDYCNRLMDTGLYQIMIAVENNAIVGFLDGLRFLEPSTGKEHAVAQLMYIKPEHRSTKVSFRLHRQMYKLFKSYGIKIFDFFCHKDNVYYWQKKGYSLTRVMMRREYV